MARFLYRRLLGLMVVLFGVSALTFGMVHMVPGDPVALMLGDQATAEDIARLRNQLGLDRPLLEQYALYVGRALRGDLGTSIRTQQPVLKEIVERFPSTLALTLAAIVLATGLGIASGVVAATSRNRLSEFLFSVFPLIGLSMPTFWSGILMIGLFSLVLGWVPVVGDNSFRSLILPAVALSLPTMAIVARLTRATMLETLSQDFVRTAKAKGVSRFGVIFRHALRAALIPVVTLVSLQLGALLGGAVVVESVFARPGIGRLAIEAILRRDFPIIQGVVLLSGLTYVTINLLAEMVYSFLDPRISRS